MSRLSASLRRLFAAAILPVVAGGALAGCADRIPRNDYVVFFERDSVVLDPTDDSVIQNAVTAIRKRGIHHIIVSGSAGHTGDPYVLKELADTRAQAVAKVLQTDGVPAQDITMGSFAPTQLESSNVALRRVTIQLVPNN